MSDIFREVEEDLRQERAKALWRRFGPYFIALCIAVVAATGGRVLWRDWQESERLEASAAYEAAAAQARTGELALAAGRFRELAGDTGTGYAVLARLQAAASLAGTDALNDAVALYDAIAADDGNPDLLRDLARLYAGMLLVDRGDAGEARRRLEPLAVPGNDWRGLAREQLAVLALREGDEAAARTILTELTEEADATIGARERARELLRALGGTT